MRRLTIASLLVVGTLQLVPSAQAAMPHGSDTMAPAAVLREGMRKLWTDHAVWTRQYIVAAVADAPDQAAAAGRLLRNQEDIGAAIVPYYGAAAGDRLTALLKEHILIAVDLIAAAKAGDAGAQQRTSAAWSRNGRDIARFLSQANPFWSFQDLRTMMDRHLETTTEEVVARLTGDWEGDVRAFDVVYDHLLHMSDILSRGIVAQFPDRF